MSFLNWGVERRPPRPTSVAIATRDNGRSWVTDENKPALRVGRFVTGLVGSYIGYAPDGMEFMPEKTELVIDRFVDTHEETIAFEEAQDNRLKEWEAAQTRAAAMLHEVLSPAQRQELAELNLFHVSGPSGATYQIRRGFTANIYVYASGQAVKRLCWHPVDGVPDEDAMLVQKLALESVEGERHVLEFAGKHPVAGHGGIRSRIDENGQAIADNVYVMIDGVPTKMTWKASVFPYDFGRPGATAAAIIHEGRVLMLFMLD